MKLRPLHLTSPLTHGLDVANLQRGLNDWNTKTGNAAIVTVDGNFGTETAGVAHTTAYRMGLGHVDMLPRIQRIIENPKLRSPLDYRRAANRRKEAAKELAGRPGLPKRAAKFIGTAERPASSNWGEPYPAQWLRNFGFGPASWCGAFAGSMIRAAGGHVTSRVAYCPFIEQDAKAHVNGFDGWTTDPRSAGVGWLVLYDWTGGKSFPEHVGIVESLGPNAVIAIEGNTGGTNPSDGGMVARATRPYSMVVGFARPRL